MSSKTSVPTIVDAHFNAINAKNTDGITATFADDAVLIDDGKRYGDRESIRKWVVKDLISYNASAVIQKCVTHGRSVVVHVVMDGDFEADFGIIEPFPLFFAFTIESDKIRYLDITSWDPTTSPPMKAVVENKSPENM